MAELMSELCEKGVELIWKQCNEALFPQGLEYLKEAAEKGDAEALFFLGHCCSWGDGSIWQGHRQEASAVCWEQRALVSMMTE